MHLKLDMKMKSTVTITDSKLRNTWLHNRCRLHPRGGWRACDRNQKSQMTQAGKLEATLILAGQFMEVVESLALAAAVVIKTRQMLLTCLRFGVVLLDMTTQH